MARQCSYCLYFSRGLCRVNPPTIANVEMGRYSAVWPEILISDRDWCGKFKEDPDMSAAFGSPIDYENHPSRSSCVSKRDLTFAEAITFIMGGGIVSRIPNALMTRRYYYLDVEGNLRVYVPGGFVANWGTSVSPIDKEDLQAIDYRIEIDVPGGEKK